uniref:Uncharacterized protein n=1 Tax=Arundo donax TaxID=35708 RepID=A0A0A9FEQ8_ARUDO
MERFCHEPGSCSGNLYGGTRGIWEAVLEINVPAFCSKKVRTM